LRSIYFESYIVHVGLSAHNDYTNGLLCTDNLKYSMDHSSWS